MSQSHVSHYTPEETLAYYTGAVRGMPKLMVGKLVLTPRYLGYQVHEVQSVGVIGKGRLRPSEKVYSFPLERVVSVKVEGGKRAKKSRPKWTDAEDYNKKASGEKGINTPPKPLDPSERFSILVVTMESEYGVEIARFELNNPEEWADAISARIGGSLSP